MATAKADTGELFLSRLSETYACRPGENVLLECYVRQQRVKSIRWYANGELVELRGFRLWHRYQSRTGQCMLYLRSVLYSDEGLYCCEATGIDGVVETLEIKLRIENCKCGNFFIADRHSMCLDDKAWTKIPVLHMAGRVMPDGRSPFSHWIELGEHPSSAFPSHNWPIERDTSECLDVCSAETLSNAIRCTKGKISVSLVLMTSIASKRIFTK